MQPPHVAVPNELRAACLVSIGQIASTDAHFDPGPTRSGPHFEHHAVVGAFTPESRIERNRLVPGARRHRRTIHTLLAFGLRLLFSITPTLQVAVKGFGRAEGGIDG